MDAFPKGFTPSNCNKFALESAEYKLKLASLRLKIYNKIVDSDVSEVTIDVSEESDKVLDEVLGELKHLGWSYLLGEKEHHKSGSEEWEHRELMFKRPFYNL